MDQPSGDVEHSESADPCDQQHHKNNCPDAHLYSPLLQGAEQNKEGVSGWPDESYFRPAGRFELNLCNVPDGHACFLATSFSGRRNILSAGVFKYFLRLLDLVGIV